MTQGVRVSASSLDALVESLKDVLATYQPLELGRRVEPIDAFYAYRLLLGRNPDPDAELPALLAGRPTLRAFLSGLLSSREFYQTGGLLPAGRLLMAELEGFRFWFDTADREMGARMAFDLYEPETVALVRRLVRPGMHCLDVGAQTGFFTCLMASLVGPSGQIQSFEPMPSSYRILTKNVEENRFQDRVRLHQLAASDSMSVLEASMISNMYIAGRVEGATPVQMHAVRIDDVVSGPVDFVKIDVEGHEPAAIAGMGDLIRRCRPVLLSEANTYWLRSGSGVSAREYVGLLRSLCYEVYDADNQTQPLTDDALGQDDLANINVIAVPAGSRWEQLRSA